MTAIITGDIINSRKLGTTWLAELKKLLSTKGESPADWEVFRGDQFQLLIPDASDALLTAMEIKAAMKKIRADIRMSIGLGDAGEKGLSISERSGVAFIRSGETFETLKKLRITMAINSADDEIDLELNLMLRFALSIMDNWPVQSAAFFLEAVQNPGLSQEILGKRLGVNQAAVSRRRKRAYFDLLLEFDTFFRKKISNLKP